MEDLLIKSLECGNAETLGAAVANQTDTHNIQETGLN
jgi:hypothetical protein